MLKARPGKAIMVRTADRAGALAELSKGVAERGLNILAMSAWVEGPEAVIRLVTDDTLRAVELLKAHGYDAQETDVVLVEAQHKPGILRHLTDTLAKENISLKHLFASALLDQDICLVVLGSSDNERAIVLLNR
jgi:hypothetical protein